MVTRKRRDGRLRLNGPMKNVKFTRQMPAQERCRHGVQHRQQHGDAQDMSSGEAISGLVGVRVGMA